MRTWMICFHNLQFSLVLCSQPQDDALAGVLGAATKGLGAEHVGFVLMAPAAATGLGRLPATSLVALADSEVRVHCIFAKTWAHSRWCQGRILAT